MVEIQYVWKQRLRCLRGHLWCGWRGAFRQHASFESSPHPKSWGLACVLYANISFLDDDTRFKLFAPDCIAAYPRPLVLNHSPRIGGGSPSSLFRRTQRFSDKPQLPNEETSLNDANQKENECKKASGVVGQPFYEAC